MEISVILPAAGLSRRFGEATGKSKIEVELAGRPVFVRAAELFLRRPGVTQVILAVNPDTLDEFRFRWGDKLSFLGITLVPGGRKERWETVLRALEAVSRSCTHVAIHDAARPVTSQALIDRVFAAAEQYPAVIPGLPVSATLKRVKDVPQQKQVDPLDAILGTAGSSQVTVKQVVETVDRSSLVEVQTPQVFERSLLQRAYAQITSRAIDGASITDDAGLLEALGEAVYVVEGESTNLKITRAQDAELAGAIAQMREQASNAGLARRRLFGDDDED